MANYYAYTRTNYFAVKDEEKFRVLLASVYAGDEILIFEEPQKDGGTKFGFGCFGRINGISPQEADEYDGEDDLDGLHEALQQLVRDDDAVIITEIGFEKLRCLCAVSTVITKDRIEWVNHNDSVMAKARELLNAPEYTTQLDY